MRVHELARNLKLDNREVVRIGKELDIDIANSMSTLTDDEANKIKDAINANNSPKETKSKKKANPRVNIEEIEKKLTKEAEEKQKLEEIKREEKLKEESKSKAAMEEKKDKNKTVEKTPDKQAKSKQDKEKSNIENRDRKGNKFSQKPNDNSSFSKDKNHKKSNNRFQQEESPIEDLEPNKDKSNKKLSKSKQKQKQSKRENKFYSDENEIKHFKRDLTKKTGNTVSKQKKAAKKEDKVEKDKVYKVTFPISVKEFSDAIESTTSEVITKLMGLGVMATINQNLDEDVVDLLALEMGIEIEKPEPEVEAPVEELFDLDHEDKEEDLVKRAPVVTVMGHVDHGKTSLLDKIKSTKVTAGEAGGITQHIGAYTVRSGDEKITFLDTPGHEAFTTMRMRGAQVTDIAILVVAADDGVMPQTIEAISHSKSAGVPIIVAINKIDKPTANPERVKQELAEQNILAEDWGGDTIMVPVSAKTGEGIDELLEMVLLVAEVLELKANPNREAVCSVIEAQLDVGRGPVATVLVQNGTLKVGDNVASGSSSGRIRAMTNDKGKNVKKAGPSMAVEIQGLSEVPNAGDLLYVFKDEKSARTFAETVHEREKEEQFRATKVSLDDIFSKIKEGSLKDLNLVVKGDVKGSVEAVCQSILKLSTDEVKINIIHSAVGGITESDITLAKASDAIIIGFNVRPNNNSLELAKKEEVDIRTYTVIYKAIEDLENAVKGMHAPEFVENFIGRCEVRDTFKLPNGSIIAGGYVISGKITRDSLVQILRDDIIIHQGNVSSLKRFKDDVREVATGYECGIGIDDFNDLKVGDIIEASIMEEVKRWVKKE